MVGKNGPSNFSNSKNAWKLAMTKRIEYEHNEQVGLIQDLRDLALKYPELWGLYAVPNEGGRGGAGYVRTSIMKAEGAKAGVSDLVLPVPRLRPGYEFLRDPATGKHKILINIKKAVGGQVEVEVTGNHFPCFMGLYVEMKRQPDISPVKGKVTRHKPSADQQVFLNFVMSQGYFGACANGRGEGLDVFISYLGLAKIPADLLKVDGVKII